MRNGTAGFIATAMLLLLLGGCNAAYVYGTAFTDTVTIDSRWERVTGDRDSTRQIYMVEFADGRVMQVSDSWLRFHFRSTDVWRAMREGQEFVVYAYGWRVPFLSMFPNVYRVEVAHVD